ncbi:uncharacterized protein G2W53_006277 [Senna tora]|uniref:Uncharacterized protein n=1 Tax=Senna tora TaxID=362788 RepID=A0A835CEM9_9FABA|nr:uncharacterized protein G2W53_006277 [Senna tora]
MASKAGDSISKVRLREIGVEGFDLIEKTFGEQKRVRQQASPMVMSSKQAAYYYGGLNTVDLDHV